ncbi:hypothetical protein C5O80_05330 [Burkholderia sp. SRS-46]|nr:hypothetical protein C5O80_05330 [Burkholderia sp. SRS-46]
MPHVTVNYEMFLPGGHHRQPRNASIELNLAPAAGGDVTPGGSYAPPYFAQLPYTLGNGNGMAALIFWSVTDGTNGQVLPPSAFNQTVAESPLAITAWYYPVTGPGSNGVGSAIIDDAFSAGLGRFIDDTFVAVTSDPSLTSNANVTGIVPTNTAEVLTATGTAPSTLEPFSEWILNGTVMPAAAEALNVPQGTTGIAVAIYQRPASPPRVAFNPNQYAIWQWVDYGTMVDGGIHPWNPYVNQLMVGVAMAVAARGVHAELRGKLAAIAAEQIGIAAAAIQHSIESTVK